MVELEAGWMTSQTGMSRAVSCWPKDGRMPCRGSAVEGANAYAASGMGKVLDECERGGHEEREAAGASENAGSKDGR